MIRRSMVVTSFSNSLIREAMAFVLEFSVRFPSAWTCYCERGMTYIDQIKMECQDLQCMPTDNAILPLPFSPSISLSSLSKCIMGLVSLSTRSANCIDSLPSSLCVSLSSPRFTSARCARTAGPPNEEGTLSSARDDEEEEETAEDTERMVLSCCCPCGGRWPWLGRE